MVDDASREESSKPSFEKKPDSLEVLLKYLLNENWRPFEEYKIGTGSISEYSRCEMFPSKLCNPKLSWFLFEILFIRFIFAPFSLIPNSTPSKISDGFANRGLPQINKKNIDNLPFIRNILDNLDNY